MFDQHTAQRIVASEWKRFIDRFETRHDDERAVLDDWTLTDLAAHCDTAIEQQTEAFRRGVVGRMEPPALDTVAKSRDERLLSLRANATALADIIGSLTPEQIGAMTPLPFGVVPTMVAMQIAGLEAGFHRYDAEAAFDPDCRLDSDVASTLLDMVPGLAPMLAAGVWATSGAPTTPIAYRLIGSTRTVDLSFDGTAWIPAPSTGDTIAVRGDDQAVALFFMGRRTLDHLSLSVEGDPVAARRFKEFFPGP